MCSPFTQLRNNPGGLNEPEASSFKAVARLITACRKGNPRINYFAETVKLHRGLTTVQGPLMDAMLPSPLQLANSSRIGEEPHRTRQIATNMIQFANVPDQPHRNPNFCVEGQLEKQPAPCLVSRANATSYPCYKRMPPKFDTNFDVTPDERDRLLGFSTTISSGYGRAPHPVSEGMRLRTIGAAFSYEVLYATMQAALDALADRVDEQHQMVLVISAADRLATSSAEQVELYLIALPETGSGYTLLKQMQKQYEGFQKKRLHVQLTDSETLPRQTRSWRTIPPALAQSAHFCVESCIAAGTHRERDYADYLWIMMFFMPLKGRLVRPEEVAGTRWEGMELQALRLLVDDRPINNAVAFPMHWGVRSPDIASLRFEIPAVDTYLNAGDLDNGYFLAELSESTKPLTCFGFYDAVAK